jgi:hypothetical protein
VEFAYSKIFPQNFVDIVFSPLFIFGAVVFGDLLLSVLLANEILLLPNIFLFLLKRILE